MTLDRFMCRAFNARRAKTSWRVVITSPGYIAWSCWIEGMRRSEDGKGWRRIAPPAWTALT